MRGDLILYKSSGAWYERFITMATRGPFVHVAIVIDASVVLAADTQGIGYSALPMIDDKHTLVSLASCADIERGLAWAKAQAGREYGWLDIAYQAVKFLWPRNPLQFSEAGHYDCSDFATRYMLQSGVVLPPMFSDPSTITPNDIARWAGSLHEGEVA